MSRQIRQALIGTIAVAVFASACGQPTAPSSSASGSAVFNTGGLVLEYPAGWARFQYDVTGSFSNLVGYLATVPVGDPCTRIVNSMTCGNTPYALAPGTLVVEILAVDGVAEI